MKNSDDTGRHLRNKQFIQDNPGNYAASKPVSTGIGQNQQYYSPLTGDKLTHGEAHLFGSVEPSKQSAPFNADCFICRDPDFAMMGLPLCKACVFCGGHVPADDCICDDCNKDQGDTEVIEFESK